MQLLSPINVATFNKSLKGSNKSLTESKNILGKMIQNSVKRTKVKRDSFAQIKSYRNKRNEYSIRQELEDELEAPNVVVNPDGPTRLANADTSKSFFERIIGFLGYVSAGWLLRNLPTWIGMGKEFIARINRAGEILSGSIGNMIDIFGGMGKVIGAYAQNLARFDFLDTENRVKNAMDGLNQSFGSFQNRIEEAFGLITTPLTEGKYSGEKIPPVGSQSQDQGAYAPVEPYTGPTSSGGVLNPQEGYAYLRQLGVSHIHALGILANIKGESEFEIGVSEKGGGGGIGLFQYTSEPRKSNFLKAVPDYKTNWRGQIKFAIGEDRGPEYLKTQFSSPEEAAYWWMDKWERPAARVYSGRNTKHNAFIKSFKPSSSQQSSSSQQQTTGQSTPSVQLSQNISASSANIISVGKGILSQGFTVAENKYFTKFKGFNPMGNSPVGSHKSPDHGTNALDITDWRGSEASGIPRLKNLFLSLYSNKEKFGIKALIFDPIGYWFTGMKNYAREPYGGHHNHLHVGFTKSADTALKSNQELQAAQIPSQAQIAATPSTIQRRAAVSTAIIPDRTPQDIVVYQPPSQQNIITSSDGGGETSSSAPVNEAAMLNNFIKNKLLLDLAYL